MFSVTFVLCLLLFFSSDLFLTLNILDKLFVTQQVFILIHIVLKTSSFIVYFVKHTFLCIESSGLIHIEPFRRTDLTAGLLGRIWL